MTDPVRIALPGGLVALIDAADYPLGENEVLWLSPHCLPLEGTAQRSLFEVTP